MRSNYSAHVKLFLAVGERKFNLAAIGPDKITLRGEGVRLDPCRGEIVMLLDGRERRWDVELKKGATPDSQIIAIV